MLRLAAVTAFAFFLVFPIAATARSRPQSDPLALALAAKSIGTLTGGTTISDVTLNGGATWITGSDKQPGAVTLTALGFGESRVDLTLVSGVSSEVRDSSTGFASGKWVDTGGVSHSLATHNCLTDAVWFFPALTSLNAGPNVMLSYVAQESRAGTAVYHLHSYVFSQGQAFSEDMTRLSSMEFYLDTSTLLPTAITFNAHPDDDPIGNVQVEIDFSSYQAIQGMMVPFHVQKYLQGSLVLDLLVSGIQVNTGLTDSMFSTKLK